MRSKGILSLSCALLCIQKNKKKKSQKMTSKSIVGFRHPGGLVFNCQETITGAWKAGFNNTPRPLSSPSVQSTGCNDSVRKLGLDLHQWSNQCPHVDKHKEERAKIHTNQPMEEKKNTQGKNTGYPGTWHLIRDRIKWVFILQLCFIIISRK